MNNKLLVICGPTGVGKTGLALELAKKFNGELVSADSRQVYKGMDIGTGKDFPSDIRYQLSDICNENDKIPLYELGGVRIWGYDLISPKENFSVSQYAEIARKIVNNIWARKKLPILVGGTGLYIRGVVDGIETSIITPNLELRKSLEGKNADELFEILVLNNPIKAASMNHSDKRNPRRLVRAIEISRSKFKSKYKREKYNTFFIGLMALKDELQRRIHERVDTRVEVGQENEIKTLLSSGVTWETHSMQALGYKEWKNYIEGNRSELEVVNQWKIDEVKYSKRQMTWFKKDKRIHWFDIDDDWKDSLEKIVEKWHNE